MRGSIYPDGVLVDHVATRRTESSKSEEIKRNRVDLTSRGMFTGAEITVNAIDNTRIDVAQLSGYTPNGEFIQTTSDYYSIVLDDYTLNAINYVVAVYTESDVGQQPHESNGQRYATEAQLAWRIRVYEESVYNALELTDDNLANDARDRSLLIGKVTANGAGIPLTSSNIFSPTIYNNILYADPRILATISGVTVLAVSSDTPTGDGTLHYDDTGAPNYTLQWESLTGGLGPVETFTIDETRNIADGLGNTIRVQVIISQLPVIAGTTTETITIHNLYYQAIPRLTGEDTYHRNLVGTGVITPNNPHGTSIDDIEGAASISLLEEHQDVMHCNGIWRESYAGIFAPTINTVAPNGDTLLIQQPVAGDLYYVNGKKLQGMNPASILFTPAEFTALNLGATVKEGSKLYEVYVDDEEVLKVNLRADTNPTVLPARTVTGTWIIDMSNDHPDGTYILRCIATASGPDFDYSFSWGDGVTYGLSVAMDNSPKPTVPPDPEGQVIRLFAPDGTNWIDLYINRTTTGPVPDAILPLAAATYTDNITIWPRLDQDQNMDVLHTVCWYNGTRPTLGWDTDFTGAGSRHTIDKRPWGNLCASEMADEALAIIDYNSTDELHYSGILFSRDDWGGNFTNTYSGAGLTFPVIGGSYYCRGKKLSVDADLTLAAVNNTSSIVYADHEGAFQVLNFGAATEFGNDLDKAMQWIMGSTFDRTVSPDELFVDGDEDYAEKGVPLYYLVTSAGNITRWLDVSRNINGPVDPWSVGLRRSDPYSATLAVHLAAFDSLEAAFLHARIYQNSAKNLNAYVEMKIVGDSYIFAGYPIIQPTNVRVSGTIASGVASAGIVTSYEDAIAGCWLLNSGCIVSDIDLAFDASVTASSFFGMAAAAVGKASIRGCNYVGDGGTYFINFNAVTDLVGFDLVDNVLHVYEGLIYDPTVGAIDAVDLNISNNYIASSSSLDDVIVVDLQFVLGLYGAFIKDNLIQKSNTGNNVYLVKTTVLCTGVNISGNYLAITNPADPADAVVGIWADGGIEVTNNFIRGDGTFGAPVAGPSLNTVVGIGVADDLQTTLIDSNTLLYTGRGIVLASMVNKTVTNNRILDCYNRGIVVDDDGGNDTLFGLTITGNYITGNRDATIDGTYQFDEYLKAIEVTLGMNAGFLPTSDIIISDNRIPALINACPAPGVATVYGVHFDISGGAGASPTIKNITVNSNYIDNLIPDPSQDVIDIRFDCIVDLPFSVDPTDPRFENLNICNNTIACDNAATFTAQYGIMINVADVGAADPLNTYNCKIANNNINVLTDDPTLTTTGIIFPNALAANAVKISNNSVAANLQGISGTFQFSSIEENTVLSKLSGVVVAGFANVIADNDILCQTEFRLTAAAYGIYVDQSIQTQGNDILNNTTFLRGDSTGTYGVLAYSGPTAFSCNIYVADDAANFVIAGNITRQHYDSIQGAGSAAHIYIGQDSRYSFSIDGNKIFNRDVLNTVPGTASLSSGLIIDSSTGFPNRRVVVSNNIIFGSNTNIVGTGLFEFSIGPTQSGTLTCNNNRVVVDYTGAAAEQVNTFLGAYKAEVLLTNIYDTYNAGGLYVGIQF